MKVTVEWTPEQEAIVVNHYIKDGEFGMHPRERQYLISWVNAHHPGKKITHAEMDISQGKWVLTLE
jgi:hypothetical protein